VSAPFVVHIDPTPIPAKKAAENMGVTVETLIRWHRAGQFMPLVHVRGGWFYSPVLQVKAYGLDPFEHLPRWNDGRVVYIVGFKGNAESPVKIGMAMDPCKRICELQNASPYEIELLVTAPGGRGLEEHLHNMFARERLRGEWFERSPRLAAFIESLRRVKE